MDRRIAASQARSARGLAEAMMWREGETNRVRGGIYDAMVGAVPPQTARGLAQLMDFVPGVGDVAGFEDAYQAGKAGNYGTAAMLGAAGLVGLAPGVGDAASSAMRAQLRNINGWMPYGGKLAEIVDGRVVINKPSAGFTPAEYQRALAAEAEKLIRPELPYFYRLANDRMDLEFAKSGKIRKSYNFADNRSEAGLSVADGPHYLADGYKGGYKIQGDVIGRGSDGEPVLDIATLRPMSDWMSKQRIIKDFASHESEVKKKLGGSYDLLRQIWLRQPYEVDLID